MVVVVVAFNQWPYMCFGFSDQERLLVSILSSAIILQMGTLRHRGSWPVPSSPRASCPWTLPEEW